jgi:anaerobic magnesium-protoporphyrin IX monomethyl ester cyclase
VVYGGSHVTFMADEALTHGNYCIRGEAEESFPRLVAAMEECGGFDSVQGLSYWDGEEMRHNPDATRLRDLDSLPIPDLSLIHGHEQIKMTPVMASRGCPFDCSFCSVTKMFGRACRFRSVESVIDELKLRQPDKVFFYDDNFAANKTRAKELLEAVLSEGLKFKWTAQVRADVSRDKELLKLMRKTDCYITYIGFESVNPATLQEFNKRQDVEEMVESIRRLHEYGIMIHGMFVIGAEHDTQESIRRTADFALRHKIDTAQFMLLTPLPGTPYFQEMEAADRLLTRDWSLYDGAHVVYQPNNLSPYELQREMIIASKRFYRLTECVKMIVSPDFLAFLAKFNANLLLGRWHNAKRQLGTRTLPWFYRAHGHFLLKRWEAANRDFGERVRSLAKRARDIASPRKFKTEG